MRYPRTCSFSAPRFLTASASSRGFSLLEILVALAIVAILAGLLFPVLGAMRRSADLAGCASNLRQIGAAFRSYATANDGYYPSPRAPQAGFTYGNPNPKGGSWQLELAPYTTAPLKAENMYRLKEVPPNANTQYCPAYVRLFPSITAIRDNGLNALGYGMNINMNVNGQDINFGGRINERFKDIGIVSPERTIIVGDSADYHLDCSGVGWKKISANAKYPEGYSSGAPERHNGKGNYLFADGHVEMLSAEQALPMLKFNP